MWSSKNPAPTGEDGWMDGATIGHQAGFVLQWNQQRLGKLTIVSCG